MQKLHNQGRHSEKKPGIARFFFAESVGDKMVRDLDPNQIGVATISCMAPTTLQLSSHRTMNRFQVQRKSM
jgi:hypothetical protein